MELTTQARRLCTRPDARMKHFRLRRFWFGSLSYFQVDVGQTRAVRACCLGLFLGGIAMRDPPTDPIAAPVHVAIKNLVGEDVISNLQFPTPPLVDELRKRTAACVPGRRFQLLKGSAVLKGDEVLRGGTEGQPLQLTLVILPAAGSDRGAVS